MDTQPPHAIDADLAQELIDLQSAGVVVQSLDGTVLQCNDAALDVLSMTADQLQGTSSMDPGWAAVDTALEPIAGHDHPAMQCATSGQPVRDAIMGVRSGQGDYRWLRIDSWPTRLHDQTCVISQFTDITAEIAARRRTTEALDLLQKHALPAPYASNGWMRVTTRYEAVSPPLDIGGDFCDVFPIAGDQHGFFLGDVCGHDLDAVATMVIARHTLRAAGLHLRRPGRVLRWLHDTLRATPDTTMCTAVYGFVDSSASGGLDISLANAGHPPPLHVGAHACRALSTHGIMIGAFADYEEPPTITTSINPGEHLVLYSDGLIESVDPRLTDDDLRTLLAQTNGTLHAVMTVIDDLIARAATRTRVLRDDTAVLVISAES